LQQRAPAATNLPASGMRSRCGACIGSQNHSTLKADCTQDQTDREHST
jgi:hypothetical protein